MTRRNALTLALAAAFPRLGGATQTKNIVCAGDSLTWGDGLSSPTTESFPPRMKLGGYLTNSGSQVSPINLGVGGRQIIAGVGAPCSSGPGPTHCTQSSGPAGCDYTITNTATDCVDAQYIAGQTNVVVLWGGTNDIGAGGGTNPTLSRVQGAYQSYVDARRALGWSVVVITISVRVWVDSGSGTAVTKESMRVSCNSTIRALTNATIVDLDANANFANGYGSGSPSYANTTYFQNDSIHLSATGQDLVAQLVANAINGINLPASSLGGVVQVQGGALVK